MHLLRIVPLLLAFAAALPAAGAVRTFPYPRPLPEIPADRLPAWKGFNLQYKFHRDWANTALPDVPDNVAEKDFRRIARLGFNFARIPLDYRIWITGGDWRQFNEAALQEIDRIVALGRTYGVHVCLNFHRAPGYTVNTPAEAKSVWTDPEAQEVCILHWRTFARRYKGIPSRELSFNLFNEPSGVDADTHLAVVTRIVEAIRAEDPNRLVICDGLDYGNQPEPRLRALGVRQATRGYQPFGLTHYKAGWVSGADTWPVPAWGIPVVPAHLYGSAKPDLQAPLGLEGDLGGRSLRIRVGEVSQKAVLELRDPSGNVVWTRTWTPAADDPEAEKIVYASQWGIYQNVYNREYTIPIPANFTGGSLYVRDGDWMTLTSLALEGAPVLQTVPQWGTKLAAPLRFRAAQGGSWSGTDMLDRAWLWRNAYRAWRPHVARGGALIGEFGAYNQTPHPVVLAWMRDLLEAADRAGLGWALWEFRGSFGILDSERKDVRYVDWDGHKLDQSMLELLQERL
jgi:aryl-phospho-beta-D-glucosidase BglC (GH1 family)